MRLTSVARTTTHPKPKVISPYPVRNTPAVAAGTSDAFVREAPPLSEPEIRPTGLLRSAALAAFALLGIQGLALGGTHVFSATPSSSISLANRDFAGASSGPEVKVAPYQKFAPLKTDVNGFYTSTFQNREAPPTTMWTPQPRVDLKMPVVNADNNGDGLDLPLGKKTSLNFGLGSYEGTDDLGQLIHTDRDETPDFDMNTGLSIDLNQAFQNKCSQFANQEFT